jgi:hypothetical protein
MLLLTRSLACCQVWRASSGQIGPTRPCVLHCQALTKRIVFADSSGGSLKESVQGLTGGGNDKRVVDTVKDLAGGGSGEGQSFKDLSGMLRNQAHAFTHPCRRTTYKSFKLSQLP